MADLSSFGSSNGFAWEAERTVVTWPDLRGGSYLLDLKAIR